MIWNIIFLSPFLLSIKEFNLLILAKQDWVSPFNIKNIGILVVKNSNSSTLGNEFSLVLEEGLITLLDLWRMWCQFDILSLKKFLTYWHLICFGRRNFLSPIPYASMCEFLTIIAKIWCRQKLHRLLILHAVLWCSISTSFNNF